MSTETLPNETRPKLWRSRWAAIGAAIAVSLGGGGLFFANAASSSASNTVFTDPVRIMDTRDPVNVGLAGPFVSQVSQKLQVTGSIPTTTGTRTVVPAGATGVLLNVTVVNATADGFISIRPGDATGAPSTSSLNFTKGDILPNAVQVALPIVGANAGKIDITYDAYGAAGPTTEILIDVVGYTSAIADVYTKAEVDAALAGRYTKTEVDTLLAGKLDNAKVLWAIVNADGTLDRGKGALVAGTNSLGTGTYQVAFERDITTCAAIANPADETDIGIAATEVTAVQRNSVPSSVFVQTRNSAGAAVNSAFTVVVVCP